MNADQHVIPGVSRRSLLWPVLLSLLVIAVIVLLTYEPGMLDQMLATLRPSLLLLAVTVLMLRILIGGLRLRYVSHGHLHLKTALTAQLHWEFASNITPTSIGGAPLVALYLSRKRTLPFGEAAAVMLFAMLLDQLWFAVSIPIILVSALYVPVYPAAIGTIGSGLLTTYLIAILLWTSFFAYATLVRPEFLQYIIERLFRFRGLMRFRERANQEMDQLTERSKVLRSQPPGFFVIGFALTIAMWMCRYLFLLLIIWSVYEAVPKFLVFIRTMAMMLTALITPTPGGAGGIEGLYALFISPLMPRGLVAPTLLTWRILGYYLFIGIGVILTTERVRKEIRDRRRNGAPEKP